jgi:hypothetical protein
MDALGDTGVYDHANPSSPVWVRAKRIRIPLPMGDWLFVHNSNNTVALWDMSQPTIMVLLDASRECSGLNLGPECQYDDGHSFPKRGRSWRSASS